MSGYTHIANTRLLKAVALVALAIMIVAVFYAVDLTNKTVAEVQDNHLNIDAVNSATAATSSSQQ